jgi:hypothetical protein
VVVVTVVGLGVGRADRRCFSHLVGGSWWRVLVGCGSVGDGSRCGALRVFVVSVSNFGDGPREVFVWCRGPSVQLV